MLHQLADADHIGLVRLGLGRGLFRGGCGLSGSGGCGSRRRRSGTCTGRHRYQQHSCQHKRKCFFHFIFFPSCFLCELLCSTGGAVPDYYTPGISNCQRKIHIFLNLQVISGPYLYICIICVKKCIFAPDFSHLTPAHAPEDTPQWRPQRSRRSAEPWHCPHR